MPLDVRVFLAGVALDLLAQDVSVATIPNGGKASLPYAFIQAHSADPEDSRSVSQAVSNRLNFAHGKLRWGASVAGA